MKSIKEYEKAKQKLNNFYEKEKTIRNQQFKEIREIENKLWEEKTKLEEKARAKIKAIKTETEKKLLNLQEQEKPLKETQEEFKRIIEFININKKEKNLNFRVFYYNDDYPRKEINYIEVFSLKNDEYAKIGLFVTNNKNPKNKYSLIIAGKTIFTKKIMDLPFDYGIYTRDENCNIFTSVKVFPTKEKAIEYIEKSKNKIFRDFLQKHEKIEKEYKETLEQIKNKTEWEVAYLQEQKKYYENNVYQGRETQEYKEIVKQLKRLGVKI